MSMNSSRCQYIFLLSVCISLSVESKTRERDGERVYSLGALSPFPEKNLIFQPPEPNREQKRGIKTLILT